MEVKLRSCWVRITHERGTRYDLIGLDKLVLKKSQFLHFLVSVSHALKSQISIIKITINLERHQHRKKVSIFHCLILFLA